MQIRRGKELQIRTNKYWREPEVAPDRRRIILDIRWLCSPALSRLFVADRGACSSLVHITVRLRTRIFGSRFDIGDARLIPVT
jgi:hypothetical protein